jgi:hypothetical protein
LEKFFWFVSNSWDLQKKYTTNILFWSIVRLSNCEKKREKREKRIKRVWVCDSQKKEWQYYKQKKGMRCQKLKSTLSFNLNNRRSCQHHKEFRWEFVFCARSLLWCVLENVKERTEKEKKMYDYRCISTRFILVKWKFLLNQSNQ